MARFGAQRDAYRGFNSRRESHPRFIGAQRRIETVMVSTDASSRPLADGFVTSLRLERVLTAILRRTKNRILDS
jgi:hypothetical protein